MMFESGMRAGVYFREVDGRLQNGALGLLLVGGQRAGIQNSADGLVKDALEVSLRESRALEVLVSLNFLGTNEGLLIRYGLHALLSQRVEGGNVVAEIELGADEDDGNVGGVMVDFGVPLGADVVKGRRADDGKANEKDVCLGVGQRAKSLVIFLTSGIPETEADGLAINHDTGGVVVEDCRDVLAGEGIGGV